jgi:hypothetical protein
MRSLLDDFFDFVPEVILKDLFLLPFSAEHFFKNRNGLRKLISSISN